LLLSVESGREFGRQQPVESWRRGRWRRW